MSVNRVTLLGNLGQAPESRYMPNGDATATVSLATSRVWKDGTTGEKKEQTDWHRIVFYRQQADVVVKYTTKGSKLYVEGRLTTRKWKDKDGQDRYITEVIGERVELLDPRKADAPAPSRGYDDPSQRSFDEAARAPQPSRAPVPATAGGNGFEDMDDDIPF
jgi:single-strand DNA-binding protein